ncbi:MAG: hypothetical protein N4A64_07870 [Marinisporobacter sp.]|nr:hypothetical protein [Marinisporobacter sp.]
MIIMYVSLVIFFIGVHILAYKPSFDDCSHKQISQGLLPYSSESLLVYPYDDYELVTEFEKNQVELPSSLEQSNHQSRLKDSVEQLLIEYTNTHNFNKNLPSFDDSNHLIEGRAMESFNHLPDFTKDALRTSAFQYRSDFLIDHDGKKTYYYNLDVEEYNSNYILSMIFEKVNHEYFFIGSQLTYLRKFGHTSEEWYTQAENFYNQEMMIPAYCRLLLAASCLPTEQSSDEFLKRCNSLFKKIVASHKMPLHIGESVDEENSNPIVDELYRILKGAYNQPMILKANYIEVPIFTIVPEYWPESDNFGYAVHYKTIPTSNEPKVRGQIHEEIESRRMRDALLFYQLLEETGHYSFIYYKDEPENLNRSYDNRYVNFFDVKSQ